MFQTQDGITRLAEVEGTCGMNSNVLHWWPGAE
jgi:hypothetical protein